MAVVERISTGATLTWNATTVLKVRDYEYGGTAPAEDVTGQEDGGQRDYIAGLRELDPFRFTIIFDTGDTVHAALNTDFAAGTKRNVVFTGPDSQVIAFECAIEELSEALPMGSVLTAELVLVLTDRDTVQVTGF